MFSNKTVITFLIFLLLGNSGSFQIANAQQADSTLLGWEYLNCSNAWFSSGNILGLKNSPFTNLSIAEAKVEKTDGRFVNFYESDNSLRLGAGVEAYRRLNSKVTFQGKVDYSSFNGKNMGGSAFIDPYLNPLDIDDFADSTRGTKKMDTYHLLGGVAAQLSKRWTIGAKVDYVAGNYAKIKDMRHINKLLDFDGYVGLGYQLNSRITLGAGYRYRRRIESVGFGIYGNTGQQYVSLINLGAFYGIAELHDDYGYTSATRPTVNTFHTTSMIVNVDFSDRWQWFNEVSYGLRTGYFGERGNLSILYTEHSGNHYTYRSTLLFKTPTKLHHLDLELNQSSLDNWQNIFRRETTSGGNSTIVYYGQNKVLNQQLFRGQLGYTLQIYGNRAFPNWIFKTGGTFYRRDQRVSQYPFYRKQAINSYVPYVSVDRNIGSKVDLYTLSLGLHFGSGGGSAKEDGVYVTPSASQTVPASQDNYLFQEFEYFSKSRAEGTFGFRYLHKIKKGQSVFFRIKYRYLKAFDVTYLGAHYAAASTTLGYIF